MFFKKIFNQMQQKENPNTYQKKDAHLVRSMTTKDFIALGVGTIVSTAIFTLPGEVAAEHAGPAVSLSFLIAALIAGIVSFAYAEMASAMPFAGSAYSWMNVIFGEFWGWIVGWALLAEYFICVAFVASGLSANLRGLISPWGINLPKALSNPFHSNGGIIDIFAVIAIGLIAFLLSRGANNFTKVENILVILKVMAIILFIIVGATAIKFHNYIPFIPKHQPGTTYGGFSGIYTGVSMIFLSYIGFDSIAANSAEAKNPEKTMPRGIIGSLIIAVVLFVGVALVLTGMFKSNLYLNNAEPVGWALRQSGHAIIASVVQAIAVLGMFTALIGMMLAGSRLIYSFGRDGMLPKFLGRLNHRHLPNNALGLLTIIGVLIGAVIPFGFLAQLISAGTLIAFMFVSIGIYSLRKREGKDVLDPKFKIPFYPVMPAIGFLGTLWIFLGLNDAAKFYSGCWFVIGIIIYLLYGIRHSVLNRK